MKVNNLILMFGVLLLMSCSGRPAVPGGSNPSREAQTDRQYGRNRPRLPNTETIKPGKSYPSGRKVYPERINKVKLSAQEIFSRYSPAVFMIFTSSGYQQYQGSGFFISEEGLAVSNYHVFKGTYKGFEVIHLQDGREFRIKEVIVSDEVNDFIIFTVNGAGSSFKYLQLAREYPQVGDKVYAIGSPRGLENTFSSGEISQLRDNNILQISAPIDHGSSGGALFNEYGEVIGITSAGIDDSGANLNFAVSTDLIKKYID